MALLKYKNQNGEYVSLPVYTVNSPQVVLDTGDSTTSVMSQNAVTLVVLNLPDNEDLMIEEDKLKLADRTYNPELFSGKGYKILRKNIIEGKNVLTLEMINEPNTVYEIRYDYDLNELEIIVPEGCALQFNGGSLSNGTIVGNNTNIESISKYMCILSVNLSGNWKINEGYPEWFGAVGDGINDDRIAIQTAVDNCDTVYFRNTKYKLGIIYYSTGGQGNLFIKKNTKLLGNNTEFILDGQGLIFTPLGYSSTSAINEEYRNKNIELITENVTYLSNIIKVNNTSKFAIGDTVLIRGEDSRVNTDYEECDQWDINIIKQINDDNSIELMSPITFNIDLTKCNRTGGVSSPAINGSIIKVSITSLVIDGFKFRENQGGSVFRFDHCINIKLLNIDVTHKLIAAFKHCANITIDKIIHKFSDSNNTNYGTLQLWGVKNCYIGSIIRHDHGIINNMQTIRILSSEGRNYNIYAELIDFTTDISIASTFVCIYGDDMYINKLKVNCMYLDAPTVSGINTKVNYFEINAFKRIREDIKHNYNLTMSFKNKTILNEVLLIYNDIENNKRDYYSFNVNKIVCSKTYTVIDDSTQNIIDDIFGNGSLCLVGAAVYTNIKDMSITLSANPNIGIEYIKSNNNQYSNVVSFLFNDEAKSLRNFYLVTNKNDEINKDNPLIVTLFFTPLYHFIQELDGDGNWEIDNGNYTKDILSIKNYPFGYLENNIIYDGNRNIINKVSGLTSDRPTTATKGFQYFDTTLNKPIWWTGSGWVDATGTNV